MRILELTYCVYIWLKVRAANLEDPCTGILKIDSTPSATGSLKGGEGESRVELVEGQIDAIVDGLGSALEGEMLARTYRAIHVKVQRKRWGVEEHGKIWNVEKKGAAV